tara:strand:- start:582 stop:1085 length:504 start_codon:yes stop_codon:yes gene_type:complete
MLPLLTTALLFFRVALVLLKIINLKTAIMITKTHPFEPKETRAIPQMELALNHAECLEEYQDRIEEAWTTIHSNRIHHELTPHHLLWKISEKFSLNYNTVLDLHRELMENLVHSLANDHFHYEHGLRTTKPLNIPATLFDKVHRQLDALEKGGRGGKNRHGVKYPTR